MTTPMTNPKHGNVGKSGRNKPGRKGKSRGRSKSLNSDFGSISSQRSYQNEVSGDEMLEIYEKDAQFAPQWRHLYRKRRRNRHVPYSYDTSQSDTADDTTIDIQENTTDDTTTKLLQESSTNSGMNGSQLQGKETFIVPQSPPSLPANSRVCFICCDYDTTMSNTYPGMKPEEERQLRIEFQDVVHQQVDDALDFVDNEKDVYQIEVIPVTEKFQDLGLMKYAELEGTGMVFVPTLSDQQGSVDSRATLPWWLKDSFTDTATVEDTADNFSIQQQDQSRFCWFFPTFDMNVPEKPISRPPKSISTKGPVQTTIEVEQTQEELDGTWTQQSSTLYSMSRRGAESLETYSERLSNRVANNDNHRKLRRRIRTDDSNNDGENDDEQKDPADHLSAPLLPSLTPNSRPDAGRLRYQHEYRQEHNAVESDQSLQSRAKGEYGREQNSQYLVHGNRRNDHIVKEKYDRIARLNEIMERHDQVSLESRGSSSRRGDSHLVYNPLDSGRELSSSNVEPRSPIRLIGVPPYIEQNPGVFKNITYVSDVANVSDSAAEEKFTNKTGAEIDDSVDYVLNVDVIRARAQNDSWNSHLQSPKHTDGRCDSPIIVHTSPPDRYTSAKDGRLWTGVENLSTSDSTISNGRYEKQHPYSSSSENPSQNRVESNDSINVLGSGLSRPTENLISLSRHEVARIDSTRSNTSLRCDNSSELPARRINDPAELRGKMSLSFPAELTSETNEISNSSDQSDYDISPNVITSYSADKICNLRSGTSSKQSSKSCKDITKASLFEREKLDIQSALGRRHSLRNAPDREVENVSISEKFSGRSSSSPILIDDLMDNVMSSCVVDGAHEHIKPERYYQANQKKPQKEHVSSNHQIDKMKHVTPAVCLEPVDSRTDQTLEQVADSYDNAIDCETIDITEPASNVKRNEYSKRKIKIKNSILDTNHRIIVPQETSISNDVSESIADAGVAHSGIAHSGIAKAGVAKAEVAKAEVARAGEVSGEKWNDIFSFLGSKSLAIADETSERDLVTKAFENAECSGVLLFKPTINIYKSSKSPGSKDSLGDYPRKMASSAIINNDKNMRRQTHQSRPALDSCKSDSSSQQKKASVPPINGEDIRKYGHSNVRSDLDIEEISGLENPSECSDLVDDGYLPRTVWTRQETDEGRKTRVLNKEDIDDDSELRNLAISEQLLRDELEQIRKRSEERRIQVEQAKSVAVHHKNSVPMRIGESSNDIIDLAQLGSNDTSNAHAPHIVIGSKRGSFHQNPSKLDVTRSNLDVTRRIPTDHKDTAPQTDFATNDMSREGSSRVYKPVRESNDQHDIKVEKSNVINKSSVKHFAQMDSSDTLNASALASIVGSKRGSFHQNQSTLDVSRSMIDVTRSSQQDTTPRTDFGTKNMIREDFSRTYHPVLASIGKNNVKVDKSNAINESPIKHFVNGSTALDSNRNKLKPTGNSLANGIDRIGLDERKNPLMTDSNLKNAPQIVRRQQSEFQSGKEKKIVINVFGGSFSTVSSPVDELCANDSSMKATTVTSASSEHARSSASSHENSSMIEVISLENDEDSQSQCSTDALDLSSGHIDKSGSSLVNSDIFQRRLREELVSDSLAEKVVHSGRNGEMTRSRGETSDNIYCKTETGPGRRIDKTYEPKPIARRNSIKEAFHSVNSEFATNLLASPSSREKIVGREVTWGAVTHIDSVSRYSKADFLKNESSSSSDVILNNYKKKDQTREHLNTRSSTIGEDRSFLTSERSYPQTANANKTLWKDEHINKSDSSIQLEVSSQGFQTKDSLHRAPNNLENSNDEKIIGDHLRNGYHATSGTIKAVCDDVLREDLRERRAQLIWATTRPGLDIRVSSNSQFGSFETFESHNRDDMATTHKYFEDTHRPDDSSYSSEFLPESFVSSKSSDIRDSFSTSSEHPLIDRQNNDLTFSFREQLSSKPIYSVQAIERNSENSVRRRPKSDSRRSNLDARYRSHESKTDQTSESALGSLSDLNGERASPEHYSMHDARSDSTMRHVLRASYRSDLQLNTSSSDRRRSSVEIGTRSLQPQTSQFVSRRAHTSLYASSTTYSDDSMMERNEISDTRHYGHSHESTRYLVTNRNDTKTGRSPFRDEKDAHSDQRVLQYGKLSIATSDERDEDDVGYQTSTNDENEKRRTHMVSKATKEILLRHRRQKTQSASENEECRSPNTVYAKEEASKSPTESSSFRVRRGHSQFSFETKAAPQIKIQKEEKSITQKSEKAIMSTNQSLATTNLSQGTTQHLKSPKSPKNSKMQAATTQSVDTNSAQIIQLNTDNNIPSPESPKSSRMFRRLEKIRKLKPSYKVDSVAKESVQTDVSSAVIEKESGRSRRSLSNGRSRVMKSLLGKIRSSSASRDTLKAETQVSKPKAEDNNRMNESKHSPYRDRVTRNFLKSKTVKA